MLTCLNADNKPHAKIICTKWWREWNKRAELLAFTLTPWFIHIWRAMQRKMWRASWLYFGRTTSYMTYTIQYRLQCQHDDLLWFHQQNIFLLIYSFFLCIICWAISCHQSNLVFNRGFNSATGSSHPCHATLIQQFALKEPWPSVLDLIELWFGGTVEESAPRFGVVLFC